MIRRMLTVCKTQEDNFSSYHRVKLQNGKDLHVFFYIQQMPVCDAQGRIRIFGSKVDYILTDYGCS